MERKPGPIYSGRILNLALESHRLPDGRSALFEIVRHPGGAGVLPVLADGRLVLIRQYRPAVDGWVVEIPAGRLEPGEGADVCVRRELVEEVGLQAAAVEKLGQMFSSVGFCDETIHLFLASGLTEVASAREPDEFIEVLYLELAEALELVAAGQISDAKTQLALLLYARRQGPAAP